MNSLRNISRKIDAMLLMLIALLALSLILSWNYYQSRRITSLEKEAYAAELLAFGLPRQAAMIIEENIARKPLANSSMKKRKVLAQIYMNDLRDYEKALSELVFIKTFSNKDSEDLQQMIDLCLNRLGRAYEVERRRMLREGEHPDSSTIDEKTIVSIGNQNFINTSQIRSYIEKINLDAAVLTPELLEAIVHNKVQEKLLLRAANRQQIRNESQFIQQVNKFEDNLLIARYLEHFVFDKQQLSEEQQQEKLLAEIKRLANLEDLSIDKDVLNASFFPNQD